MTITSTYIDNLAEHNETLAGKIEALEKTALASGAVKCPYCGEIIAAWEVKDSFERSYTAIDEMQKGNMETMVCNGCHKFFVVEFECLLPQDIAHKIQFTERETPF